MVVEKEDLRLLKNERGQGVLILMNPICFRQNGTIREIVRWQMFNDDGQREIILLNDKGEKMGSISNEELQYARINYFGDERKKFLDEKAAQMSKAENVFIRRMSVNPKLPPLKDIQPFDKSHPLSKAVVSFLTSCPRKALRRAASILAVKDF